MSSNPKIFAVTGANKGLGKSIVKLLLNDKTTEKVVYLTSRNTDRGKNSLKELEALGVHAQYHQLDITDKDSIKCFCNHLVQKHNGLDVLINNAGIAYKVNSPVPFAEQVHGTINNDFFGTLNVCNEMIPILKNGGRVVNISAQTVERVYPKLSKELQNKLFDQNLNLEGLQDLMLKFVVDAKNDQLSENGWVKHAYGTAKIGINIMTQILQKNCHKRYSNKDIVINCCCPGTIDTDMTGGKEKYPHAISPEEAADTPLYLASLPIDTDVRGCFVILRSVRPFPLKT